MTGRDGLTALVVALVVVTAAGGVTVASTTAIGGSTSVATEPPAAAAAQVTATDAADGGFTDCVNGTSRSLVACGYSPGPTAVELSPQRSSGTTVRVRAADLADGGFVAVHRATLVDGAVVESLVGVSGHLEAGLHTDVHVRLSDPLEEDAAVYAVVYRDSDGDATFEFDDSAGAVDRPYTVTYDPETGGISDDAGDVVGDAAAVTVVDAPVVAGAAARDLDGDGRYEDVNGDGRATVADVQALFANWDTPPVQNDPAAFDFNADGRVSMADVQRLFVAVRG